MNYKKCHSSANSQGRAQKKTLKQAVPGKNEVTHTDFMNFLDPFFESASDARYKELVRQRGENECMVGAECYKKYRGALKIRLCSCYIFDEAVELEDVCFDTELVPTARIEHSPEEVQFFRKNLVLNEFELRPALGDDGYLLRQTAINNRRRLQIGEAIRKRIRPTGYFQIYDLIHKELETIYKKIRVRRKKKQCDVENDTIREYLRRMDEFFDIFGKPGQFSNSSFIFPDILSDDSRESEPEECFTYLI